MAWERVDVQPRARRRHPVLRVLRTLVVVAVLLVVVLALVLAVSLRHSPDGQTTLFGRPAYSVDSGSMTPTIDTGDAIIDQSLSAAAAAHLHKGQIITFRATPAGATTSGLVITHRIYAVIEGGVAGGVPTVEYRTKGDANNAPDVGLVLPSAVLGVYRGERIPFGGYVLNALHQPITFVILIMIVVVYLAEELIRRKWVALGIEDAQRRLARANHRGDL